jgi:hypothetical protein
MFKSEIHHTIDYGRAFDRTFDASAAIGEIQHSYFGNRQISSGGTDGQLQAYVAGLFVCEQAPMQSSS